MANYSGPDKDMPVNQLFQPANLYGAMNDHDYVASAEAQFLKNEKVMQPCNDSFGHPCCIKLMCLDVLHTCS